MQITCMERVQLGGTRERISEIGLGTWQLSSNEQREAEALTTGIESGINFIDTAEVYGTEPIVSKAIAGRENIFVATKVSPTHFSYDDVLKACDASLRKLDMKAIDLYQLHWPNKSVPITETMRAMEKLVADGKVRHIGVSNFSIGEMKEAQAALKSNDLVSNQVEYSVLARDVERGLLDYCKKERVSVIAYSPLARGHIFDPRYARLVEFLSGIGRKYEKTPAQVAINWLICKGGVIPIPKASRKEHVAELVGAAGWRLRREDVAALDSFLSSYRRRSLASVLKPVINSHPAVRHALTWMAGLRTKAKK